MPSKAYSFSNNPNELPFSKPPANVKRSYPDLPPMPSAFTTFNDPAAEPVVDKKRKTQASAFASADDGRVTTAAAKRPRTDAVATPRKPVPKTPLKRKRKTKGPPIQQRAIPRNFDECDEADKLLITLRDAGAEWEEIVGKWKTMTGETKVGKSTLPNRYNRLKENFSVIREEDSARLIEAKREIEEAFERGKWARIAGMVRQKGGDAYAPPLLQRQYKKLMLGVGARPPPGVRDADFDGVEPLPASPDPRDAGRVCRVRGGSGDYHRRRRGNGGGGGGGGGGGDEEEDTESSDGNDEETMEEKDEGEEMQEMEDGMELDDEPDEGGEEVEEYEDADVESDYDD